MSSDFYNTLVEFTRQTEIDRILEKHHYVGYGMPESNSRCACDYQWPCNLSISTHIDDELNKLNRYWDGRRK